MKILVIGGLNLDIIFSCKQSNFYSDSNCGVINFSVGGVGYNIAVNLAKLDVDLSFFSVCGDQFDIISKIDEKLINKSKITLIPNYSCATYLSIIDLKGKKLYAVNDMEVMDLLTVDLIKKNYDLFNNKFDIIVIDCNLNNEVISWIFQNKNEAKIFVDSTSKSKTTKLKKHLKNIYCLKANRSEAIILLGLDANVSNKTIAFSLMNLGISQAFITLGAKGAYYINKNNEQGLIEVYYDKLVNTIGAGDSFFSGTIFGYLNGCSIKQQTLYGMVCAGITLSETNSVSSKLNKKILINKVNQIIKQY